MSVKEKKDRISPEPPTYASGLTTKRNPYVENIKPDKFYKCIEQANQFFNQEGPDPAVCKAMELSWQR